MTQLVKVVLNLGLSSHRGTKRPTYYKREFDRALWERAQSRCEFIDEKTGRRCDCRFGLQREHVIPLALGGTNDLSNMQLLCATHNQLRARRVFGNKKINAYQAWKNTIEPIM
jgi:5-methylcytosine-specific restriction endonuclease McrA